MFRIELDITGSFSRWLRFRQKYKMFYVNLTWNHLFSPFYYRGCLIYFLVTPAPLYSWTLLFITNQWWYNKAFNFDIFQTESNKSWHESTAGSDLSQFQDDSDPHHSSPNSSISKYRVDSNPKDSSPSSSISQYKEDSLHKNDSPISNKSDLSDSYFW